MLSRPRWIAIDDRARPQLRYVWDDTRALQDFSEDAGPALRSAMQMSVRARMVFCMGLFEWNLWRFEDLHGREEPEQIAEVGWCATVDPRYMKFFELTREEWRGPVEGPLWCAIAWLQPALSLGHLFPKQLYDAISVLTRMALHVLPDRAPFHHWLGQIGARLAQTYPDAPADPFSHLFDRDVPDMLGPLIGRDALDPSASNTSAADAVWLAQVLQHTASSGNPFLATPSDLKDAGFTKRPYQL